MTCDLLPSGKQEGLSIWGLVVRTITQVGRTCLQADLSSGSEDLQQPTTTTITAIAAAARPQQ